MRSLTPGEKHVLELCAQGHKGCDTCPDWFCADNTNSENPMKYLHPKERMWILQWAVPVALYKLGEGS